MSRAPFVRGPARAVRLLSDLRREVSRKFDRAALEALPILPFEREWPIDLMPMVEVSAPVVMGVDFGASDCSATVTLRVGPKGVEFLDPPKPPRPKLSREAIMSAPSGMEALAASWRKPAAKP